MLLPDLVIRSPRVVAARGTRPAAIHIRRGRIVGVMGYDEYLPETPVATTDAAILPGLVDTHVHGTRTAYEGGVTTIVPVPAETLLIHENDILQTRTRAHVLHLSSCEALTPLFRAQQMRIPISAETCPHYLTLVAGEIRERCSPPIRERANREYLWAALANGLIRMVVSDHREKASKETCGLPTLPYSLAATWTEARSRGHSLDEIADWMCRAPARLAQLQNKGQIDVGFAADLVAFRPEEAFTPDTTVYKGRKLYGVVEKTWVAGERVYSR